MKMTITNDDGSLFGEYFVMDMSQSWCQGGSYMGLTMKEVSVRGMEVAASTPTVPHQGAGGGNAFHKTYTSPALVAPTKRAPEPTFRRVGTPCPEVLDLTEEKVP